MNIGRYLLSKGFHLGQNQQLTNLLVNPKEVYIAGKMHIVILEKDQMVICVPYGAGWIDNAWIMAVCKQPYLKQTLKAILRNHEWPI